MLVTHNYVLVETSALAQNRLGMPALRAIEEIIMPVLRVQWITQTHHRTAVEMVLAAHRRKLSLVDCASFLIMREQGISEAFTFDKHFTEQGFHTVPSERL
jgi:predicted nucleic acid-binding protein